MGLQVGRLTLPLAPEVAAAIEDFDCSSGKRDDPVATNVCNFLRDQRFVAGIEHNFSATYLLIDRDLDPQLIGYVTLTLDAVRLTNAEKRVFGEQPDTGGFGAARIQMIGVDSRHQNVGYAASSCSWQPLWRGNNNGFPRGFYWQTRISVNWIGMSDKGSSQIVPFAKS